MKLRLFIFITLIVLISACRRESLPDSTYLAINGKDTVELKLIIDKDKFYGTYKTTYSGGISDSGHVRGNIKGDTLIGSYRYRPYDMAHFKLKPIALLRGDDGVLIQGNGQLAVYMTVSYFWEKVPIQYDDPEFVFKPVQ